MKAFAISLLLLTGAGNAFAQASQDEQRTGAAIGWDISSFSNNYGIGVRLESPNFANGRVRVQFGADFAWVQGVKIESSTTTWAPYTLLRLGVVRINRIGDLPLRFYGGGGAAVILPTNEVSDEGAKWGGYGVTGLELLMPANGRSAWFAELGGMGTGAQADKLANKPIYANGFIIGWGFRYYL
jgi:hypothetical protein